MMEDHKIRPAQIAAVGKYERKTYDKVLLRIRKDGADGITAGQIRDAAAGSGRSVNAYILDAVRRRMQQDNR